MALLVRNGGSRHTGLAAPPQENIHFRLVFAMGIVINHSILFNPNCSFGRGALGVEFFLIVSGFLMAKKVYTTSYSKDSLGYSAFSFVRSKYMQVFYNFVVAIICSLLLQAVVYHWNVQQIIHNIIFSIPELLCLQMTGFDNLFFATGVAWYLSGMLIVMWVMFPLLTKYRQTVSYIVAPLLACFIYGFLWQTEGHLGTPGVWINNIIHKGVLKALAGICLGIISYELCSAIQKRIFTTYQKILITIAEYSCWIIAVGGMYFIRTATYYDFFITGALFVAISLCFSNQSYITQWINRYDFSFFRTASICIYFNNYYISSIVSKTLQNHTITNLMAIYLTLVLVMSLINHFGASILRRFASKGFTTKE